MGMPDTRLYSLLSIRYWPPPRATLSIMLTRTNNIYNTKINKNFIHPKYCCLKLKAQGPPPTSEMGTLGGQQASQPASLSIIFRFPWVRKNCRYLLGLVEEWCSVPSVRKIAGSTPTLATT